MTARKIPLLTATALLAVSLMACDSPEEKYAKYIDRGAELFDQGAYDKARLEFKNAARLKPADAEVRYRLGLIDEAQGKLPEAFKNFVMAEQQNAQHHEALLKLAQYFIAGEQNEEAYKRINALLAIQADDADALALRGSLRMRGKELDLAEQDVRKALALEPDNVIAYSVLTGLYVTRGDIDKAGETVEEGVRRNPKNVGLLLLKAMIYERSSNIDKISEAYKVIFNLKPEEVRYRDDLAKVYAQADKIDDAEKVLRDGVASMPENWDMKKKLIAFLNEKRGLDVAEKALKDYMLTYPDNKELVFWLADLYLANKATDRAVALLQDVVKQTDEEAKEKHGLNARTSLARIHYVKGDRQLAEKLTQGVLAHDPDNKEALLVRARMLFEDGDYQNAVVALRTIVRGKTDSADALQLLGESLLAQGYTDLAADTFTQLVQVAPTSSQAKVRLAQLLSAQGDHARALALLALVTSGDPTYPIGWESTARVALEAKNWTLAEEAIKNLEAMEGRANIATFLRGQTAVAKGLYEEAIVFNKQVISADITTPLAGHALRALVEAYRKIDKAQEAASYLATLDQTHPLVLTLTGRIQTSLGQFEAAALAYDRAIANNSRDVETFIARAQLFIRDKKIDEALSVLSKAEAASLSDVRLSMMRAGLLVEKKQYPQAIAVYEKILSRTPNVDAAANNAAQLIADYLFDDPAMLEKARLLSERFIRSTSPYFLDTFAWVAFRQGRIEQALTIYERILASDNAVPEAIYYHYGMALAKMGRVAEAKTALQKAVEPKEPYAGLEEAQRLLSGL